MEYNNITGDKVRKEYSKPMVTKVMLDNSISLVMMTTTPINPTPRGMQATPSGASSFDSPFKDSSFQ